jgi:hypothetical protein
MARALGSLGLDVDLGAHPWRYPGPSAATAGLLHDATFHPLREVDDGWADDEGALLDALLRAAGAPVTAERHAVVAIGSNASPAVLHAKLARADAPTTVPLLSARLRGVGTGHLPHVNPAGYVAAVPLAVPGSHRAVVVALLTDAQTAAIDATEPRYLRRTGGDGLALAGHTRPWSLYVSRLGAVAADDGTPLAQSTQASLWRTVRHDPRVRALTGPGDHRDVARRLAADPVLREQVHTALLRRGTPATGLEGLPPA